MSDAAVGFIVGILIGFILGVTLATGYFISPQT